MIRAAIARLINAAAERLERDSNREMLERLERLQRDQRETMMEVLREAGISKDAADRRLAIEETAAQSERLKVETHARQINHQMDLLEANRRKQEAAAARAEAARGKLGPPATLRAANGTRSPRILSAAAIER